MIDLDIPRRPPPPLCASEHWSEHPRSHPAVVLRKRWREVPGYAYREDRYVRGRLRFHMAEASLRATNTLAPPPQKARVRWRWMLVFALPAVAALSLDVALWFLRMGL